ncbi:unnamed protein product, partial [marine sediment metagenome]
KKRLIFEFIRFFLLVINKKSFSSFVSEGPPELSLIEENSFYNELDKIKSKILKEAEEFLKNFIKNYKIYFDFDKFKKDRFLVLDVEYIHVPYPIGNSNRIFNFPSIVSNIIWQGIRKGFKIELNIFVLPCHFCSKFCKWFKKRLFNFNCLTYGSQFYEDQIKLIDEMLIRYENLKIYSYGKSDFNIFFITC